MYFDAAAVSNPDAVGKVYEITGYFNKRFYKYTESNLSHLEEDRTLLDKKGGLTLFASEGSTLPSKTELNWAKVCNFDLYTITNMAFADLAVHLGMETKLFAVCRSDLRGQNTDEYLNTFASIETYLLPNKYREITRNVDSTSRNYALPLNASLDLIVSLKNLTGICSMKETQYLAMQIK